MENQQHAEQVRPGFGGDHVAVIQTIIRRERQQNSRQRNPVVASEPAQRQPRQHRGPREKQQHHNSRGVELRREVVGEGRHGELNQQVAARREAVVKVIAKGAVFVQNITLDPREVARGGQVRRQRYMIRRDRVMETGPMKLAAVLAEQERRRQRRQQ